MWLKCKTCGKFWDYTGKQLSIPTCPNCKTDPFIDEIPNTEPEKKKDKRLLFIGSFLLFIAGAILIYVKFKGGI